MNKLTRASCSVLMPIHKENIWLQECIDSILNNCQVSDEILIVVDSKDLDLFGKIRSLTSKHHFVNFVVEPSKGTGIVDALNYGLEISKHEFIVRIDSDDVMKINRINSQINYLMNNPTIAAVGGAIEFIDERSNLISLKTYPTDVREVRRLMLEGCQLAHPAVTFRKSYVLELGGYNRRFEFAEDYELWLRLLRKYDIANLPEVVLAYRQHSSQISRIQADKQTSLTKQIISSYFRNKSDNERPLNQETLEA